MHGDCYIFILYALNINLVYQSPSNVNTHNNGKNQNGKKKYYNFFLKHIKNFRDYTSLTIGECIK